MNSNIVVSCLDIKLGHLGPTPVLGEHVDDLTKFDVVHGELIWVNTIVNTWPPGGWQVDNETPIANLPLLFLGLPRNCLFVSWEAGPKGWDQQPYIMKPFGPSNHLWPWGSETLREGWKPRRKPCWWPGRTEVGDSLPIRVPSQIQGELYHVQRRNHWHWMKHGTPRKWHLKTCQQAKPTLLTRNKRLGRTSKAKL